jgi:hypothetical protein
MVRSSAPTPWIGERMRARIDESLYKIDHWKNFKMRHYQTSCQLVKNEIWKRRSPPAATGVRRRRPIVVDSFAVLGSCLTLSFCPLLCFVASQIYDGDGEPVEMKIELEKEAAN